MPRPPVLHARTRQDKSNPKTDNCDEINAAPAMPQIGHVAPRLVVREGDAQLEREGDELRVTCRGAINGERLAKEGSRAFEIFPLFAYRVCVG